MYPNVKAEMARRGITLADIAKDPSIDKTVSTMSLKFSGKAPITLTEAMRIKAILGTDLPLETLFEVKDEEGE